MKVEIEVDDDVLDAHVAEEMIRVMQDMVENKCSGIAFFHKNKKKDEEKRMELAHAARVVHAYFSLNEDHIKKDFSNL